MLKCHNSDNIAAGYNFLLSARGFYEPCLLLFRILKQDLPDILTIKARQLNVPAEAILSCISLKFGPTTIFPIAKLLILFFPKLYLLLNFKPFLLTCSQ